MVHVSVNRAFVQARIIQSAPRWIKFSFNIGSKP